MNPQQTYPEHLSGAGALTRVQHRCGRFLGELRDGTIYVLCARCNDLVPVVMDRVILEGHLHTAHIARRP